MSTTSIVDSDVSASRSEKAADRSRVVRRMLLVLTLLLAAFVRLQHLGSESLWFDEAATVHIVMAPANEALLRFRTTENTPPLHYALLWIWVHIFGDSEVSMRMPSVIAGVASVYLLYRLLRLLGGQWDAVIAALLLACSRYQIFYSQEARAYELMMCLSLLSCCAFVRLINDPTRKRQIHFTAATMLLLYTHLFSVFVIMAQNIAYLASFMRRERPRLRLADWLGVQLATAAMFLPFTPLIWGWLTARGGSFWIKPFTLDEISASYRAYAGSTTLLLIMMSLSVVGLIARRRNRLALALLLSLLLLPVIVPVVGSILSKPLFVARYGIVASPALCALTAWGISALKPRAVMIAATLVVSSLSLLAPAAGSKEDWRGVATYIAKWASAGDRVVINRRDASRAYEYYNLRPDVHFKGFWGQFITLGTPMPPGVHVWLVLYDPNVYARDIINNGNWTVVSQKVFNQIAVYELSGGQTEPFPPKRDPERFNARPATRERALIDE